MKLTKFAKYLLFLFFFATHKSQIVNFQEVCSQLRTNLLNNINYYQQMNYEDREELFKFSLREFTLTLLQNTQFENEETNQRVLELIDNSRTFMANYLEYQNITPADFQKEYDKLYKTATKAEEALAEKKAELDTEEAKLEGYKSQMRELRDSLTSSNFNASYNLYRDLSAILASIKNASLDSNVLVTILEEFEKRVQNLYQKDAALAQNIRATHKDYLFLKELIETNDEVKSRFKLVESQELVKDLKALRKNLSSKESSVNDQKKKLIKKIEKHVSSTLDTMNLNQNYKKFKEILKLSKKSVKKVQKLRFDHLKLQKNYNAKDFRLDIHSLRQIRMNPRDYLKLEPKLYNLGQLAEMVNENYQVDADLEADVSANRESFYQHNTERQAEVTEKYQQVRAQAENLQNLRVTEKEIDAIFGEVVAQLQGSTSPSHSFEKCFTTLELSVLFYYSTLFQFIICKKSFMRAFLGGISEHEQLVVVKQIFKDLREDTFTDSKMINIQTGEFSPGGVEQAVLNYDLFMNEEFDEIFKLQLSDREKLKSKIATVLNYAGISGKFVLTNAVKTGFKVLFVSLAGALAVFITVSLLPGILSILIIGLVLILIKLVYNWLGNVIRQNAHLRNDFMRGLTRFISKFTSKEIETLDYNQILDETKDEMFTKKMAEAKSQTPEESQVKFDRTKYFRDKFVEIIQMTVTSESIDYIDVYQGLM